MLHLHSRQIYTVDRTERQLNKRELKVTDKELFTGIVNVNYGRNQINIQTECILHSTSLYVNTM